MFFLNNLVQTQNWVLGTKQIGFRANFEVYIQILRSIGRHSGQHIAQLLFLISFFINWFIWLVASNRTGPGQVLIEISTHDAVFP